MAAIEYRLPLFWIDRGSGTLPAFARNLSAAFFVDAGNAFDGLSALRVDETLVGAGAELRGAAVLGWGIPLSARLGYAFALRGEGGYTLGDPGGLYLWLGTSF